MINRYDTEKPLHDLEGWIVFYGQQAQRLQDDPEMAEVFQASCETADLLLDLQRRKQGLQRVWDAIKVVCPEKELAIIAESTRERKEFGEK